MTHLERLEHVWSATHDEYRGYAGDRFLAEHRGKRTILVYGLGRTELKLLEDLTDEEIAAKLPVHLRHLPIAQIRKFKPELITEVDHLLDQYCDREIADILNERGSLTWEGKPFNLKKIAFIRAAYKLASRHERLRRRGMLTTRELAAKFGVAGTTVHDWGRQGLIKKHYADSLNCGLWEIPSGIMIIKGHGGRDAHHAAIVPSPE